jgi:site-specific DNA recombinase
MTSDLSPKPVGIWIRVSTEDQAKGESPKHHERRARMYAEAKGWRARDVYQTGAAFGELAPGNADTEWMSEHARVSHTLVSAYPGRVA